MKIVWSTILVLGLAAFRSISSAEDMTLELIQLQHRTTDEIIPVIQALVHPGGTVTGMNNQLIVKTTASNLVEIKQLLAEIDKAARRLLITVRQDVNGEINKQHHGVSGRYSSGDVSISSGN